MTRQDDSVKKAPLITGAEQEKTAVTTQKKRLDSSMKISALRSAAAKKISKILGFRNS